MTKKLFESKLYQKLYKTEPLLLTDFYEMTMGKFPEMEKTATFTLYHRKSNFAYPHIVLDGIELAISAIQGMFPLKNTSLGVQMRDMLGRSIDSNVYRKKLFSEPNKLSIRTMIDGIEILPNTPIMTVTGPAWQCYLVEGLILNCLNTYSPIATKAKIIDDAALQTPVFEFGFRRASGLTESVLASRSCYISGCVGTSNVKAHLMFDIPIKGTMSHAFVMAFEDELEAMKRFSERNPENAFLLVDTYDAKKGIDKACSVLKDLKNNNKNFKGGIRIDDELEKYLQYGRDSLNNAGITDGEIIASGDIDEKRILELLTFPKDIFAVGKKMVKPHEDIDFVYKMSVFDGRPVMKQTKSGSIPGLNEVLRCICYKETFDLVVPSWLAKSYYDGTTTDFAKNEIKDLNYISPLMDIDCYSLHNDVSSLIEYSWVGWKQPTSVRNHRELDFVINKLRESSLTS